ncbi:hypothetical protein [Streptomyces sp. NPDC005485]|uniref:hypothetical protein n=1 Tax=Streptomyces sp. NPDC005485 TaxID=3155591 RepID=UPI0033BA4EB5
MFAYGGNIAGGDPCTPSDTATVVDLDTGTHTTTALPGGDRSTPLRITGVWFGPHDEVEAGVFTQPAEVCTAGASARRQPTAVYRLEDGVWTPSGQNAVMARTTAHGWSARRAADAGLTDFRPPASPLVVSDAKNRELRLGDSVTAFAWAPADTTPDPVLGTLWAPYQKGYGLARPTMVYNGGSPAGMVRDVKWTSWGGERATGTGQSVYTPDGVAVADGTWEESTVVAFDLGNCEGTRTYRKIVWFLPKRGGRFDPTHYIDVCAGKFWNSP